MRIAQGFSREAIQLDATKKPPIAFEVEEGADRKLEESEAGTERTKHGQHGWCVHPAGTGSTEGQHTDFIQQQAGYV
eukprot:14576568-Ditylum_brightwellii.AAC.1